MKKITKMLVLAFALVVSFSLGTGSTAEAAKKVTVKKVASVDKLTGKKTIKLTKGKKATLKTTVTVNPNKSANKKVTYKSSNKSVATVNSKGVITAKKNGSATITVTSKKNSKKKAKVKVTVVSGKVTKVKLNKTAASLEEGQNTTLKATVSSKGKKANKTVKWTSSNTAVATVSSKGVVTAKKAGTAVIKAASTDGTKKSASCKVTVTAKPAPAPAKTYTTTVTPVDQKNVAVVVNFKENVTVENIQSDVDEIAKFSNDKEVVITLDGEEYTATVADGHVKIGGKLITESEKAKNAKTVTVRTAIKADKIASVTAFAPASIASVQVGSVTFADITKDSFKIGATTYKYTVSGKNIVVEGDAKAALSGLGDVVTITVTEK